MKVKEKSEKVGLKLNIQKTKIRASGPITSWKIDGETVETVTDYFLGVQNYCTTALISHASKVMLKVLHARLQQYVYQEIPDV